MYDQRGSEAAQLPDSEDPLMSVSRRQLARLFNDLLSREDHAAFVHSLEDDPELATT